VICRSRVAGKGATEVMAASRSRSARWGAAISPFAGAADDGGEWMFMLFLLLHFFLIALNFRSIN
jgi:hypothetical protein